MGRVRICSQKHKEEWWRLELGKEGRAALIMRKEEKITQNQLIIGQEK